MADTTREPALRQSDRVMAGPDDPGGLHRTITWKGAFWVASGVPAL